LSRCGCTTQNHFYALPLDTSTIISDNNAGLFVLSITITTIATVLGKSALNISLLRTCNTAAQNTQQLTKANTKANIPTAEKEIAPKAHLAFSNSTTRKGGANDTQPTLSEDKNNT
jgi:hypothetical protein